MRKLVVAPGGPNAMMRRRLQLFLATVLVTVASVASAGDPPATHAIDSGPAVVGSDLPDLGSPAEQALSKTDEYRLGAMVARELRDQSALIEDPEIDEYINSIGQRLASQSAMGGEYFHYFVIKDTTINAFAVSGGYVFINGGLVLATETESQLAGVMA